TVETTIDGQSASITELSQVVASGSGVGLLLENPGMESDFGWGYLDDSNPNASNTLDTESAYVGTSPHSGSRVMRFGSPGVGGNRYNTTRKIPIDPARKHRLVGWSRATQSPASGYEYWQL